MSFSAMGLCDAIVKGTVSMGYESPTEIQRETIPLALAGKDVIGCAPTGTGKTAAFILPILHNLTRTPRSGRPGFAARALVLTPTRELAQQIEDVARSYGTNTGVRTSAIYGGVSMDRQLRDLRHGVDIVIATPGRLLDHVNRRSVDLSHVQTLVIDEADRMFDMGFIQDVRKIISYVPRERQTLLFSATMSQEVRSLTANIQKNPSLVEIGEQNRPVDSVEQHFYSIPATAKTRLLVHVLKNEPVECMLVFSRTKHGADRIVKQLSLSGIEATAIHSNRSQSQRQRALDGFKQREYRVLVATDIAARGIDVEKISHVVNYDTPPYPDNYIHRIGRTGRAAEKGSALTFVSMEERKYMKKIEFLTRRRFELKAYPGFVGPQEIEHPVTSAASARRPAYHERLKRAYAGRRFR